MTAVPRPGAAGELYGNTVRIVHGPIRLAIVTDTPLPAWAWERIADLATLCARLSDELDTGAPAVPEGPPAAVTGQWAHVEWVGNAARADEFATVDAEGDIGCGDSTPDVAPPVVKIATHIDASQEWLDALPAVDQGSGSEHLEEAPETGNAPPSIGRRYARLDCPDCGRNISRAQYGNHRRLKHPTTVPASTPDDPIAPLPAPKPVTARDWATPAKGTPRDQPIDIPVSTATAQHAASCECLTCWTRSKKFEKVERAAAEQHARDTAIPWGANGENPPRPTVRLNHPPAHELT